MTQTDTISSAISRHADLAAVTAHIDAVLATRRDDITQTVRRIVAEVLNISVDAVSATASLQHDLGAESLDHLDLIFRLETTYGVKIPRDGIGQMARKGIESDFEREGRLTQAAAERLQLLLPEVDPGTLTAGYPVGMLNDLFTVETFVRLVSWRLPVQ
jgi:acyl carrier protein